MKIKNLLTAVLICILGIVGVSCEQIPGEITDSSSQPATPSSSTEYVPLSENTTPNETFPIITDQFNPFHIELEPEKKDLPASSEFQKIKIRMSEEEVRQIIGLPQHTETYRSMGPPASSSAVNITFYVYDSFDGDSLRIFYDYSDSSRSSVIVEIARTSEQIIG